MRRCLICICVFLPLPQAHARTCLDYRTTPPGTPPPLRATLTLPGPVLDVASLPGHIYLACSADGLRIAELDDPDAPLAVGHLGFGADPAARVAAYGCRCYVATGAALEIVDVTEADAPASVGRLAAGGTVVDVAAGDDRLVAVTAAGEVVVWSVGPCAPPGPAGRVAVGGDTRRVAVGFLRAFVATDAGLAVVDLGVPGAPVLETVLEPGQAMAAVAVWGDSVLAVGGTDLYLWTPSGPDPALVRRIALPAPATDLAADGSELHVLADTSWTIFSRDFFALRRPVGKGTLPATAAAVDIGGPGVFFASGAAGVVEAWRQCAIDPPVAAPPPTGQTRLRVVPNPANPQVILVLEAAGDSGGSLTVHDLRGRSIAVLHDGPLPVPRAVFRWSGRDARGRPVPSGRYIACWRSEHGNTVAGFMIVR